MVIQLTAPEYVAVANAGFLENASAVVRGIPNAQRLQGAGYTEKIQGTIAEYVVSLALELPWRPIKPVRGADLPGVEVRSTEHERGCLILHPSDDDDKAFVLVIGQYPRYRVAGWIVARLGKTPDHWREQARQAAFFVPQPALAPIETLKRFRHERQN